MSNYRTRIAPTPSGYLHLGNLVNALYAWAKARMLGGEVMLRIDDVDVVRLREEYVTNIFDTFEWLGIDWDIGPTCPSEYYQTWSQQHRVKRYNEVLYDLRENGKLFACTCTRSQIRTANATMRYPGTCEHAEHDFDAGDVSWRLRTPSTLELPYVVVRQKEGNPAYNLASVVDDVDFGITHIVRGSDLQPASEVQQHLAQSTPALAPFTKIIIEHHPLLVDEDGNKLSKSGGGVDAKPIVQSAATHDRAFSIAAAMLGIDVTALKTLK